MTRTSAHLILLVVAGSGLLSCTKDESAPPAPAAPLAAEEGRNDAAGDSQTPESVPASLPSTTPTITTTPDATVPTIPAGSASSAAPVPPEANLALRPDPAMRRWVYWHSDQQINFNNPSQRQDVRQEATVLLAMEVRPDTATDPIVLKFTYVSPSGGRASDRYSGNLLEALDGSSFHVRLTASGRIISIEDVDTVTAAVRQAVSHAAHDAIENVFGAPALQEMIEHLLPPRPGQPVQTGQEWSQSSHLANGAPASINTTWRVEGCGSGITRLTASSIITADNPTAAVQLGPARITCRLSGSQDGELTIDETSGLPVLGKFTRKLDGTVRIESPGLTATWPVNVTSTELITVTRHDPR